jgi:hypothetical protein
MVRRRGEQLDTASGSFVPTIASARSAAIGRATHHGRWHRFLARRVIE